MLLIAYFFHSYRIFIAPENNLISLIVSGCLIFLLAYTTFLYFRYKFYLNKILYIMMFFFGSCIAILNFMDFMGYSQFKSLNAIFAAVAMIFVYFFCVSLLINLKKFQNKHA